MNGVPDISVILLTYNQQDTLERALGSILAQDTGPWEMEIVVSDDGSTDLTRARIEALAHKDSRIRLLPPEPNKGLVANYFSTLARCRGRYVTDCAGDDFWLGTDRLRVLTGLLDDCPSANIAFTDYISLLPGEQVPCDIDSDCSDKEPEYLPGRSLMEPMLAHVSPLSVHLSAALYRRSVIVDALGREPEMIRNERFGCEDFPVMMALLAAGDAVHIPAVTLAYTVGTSSVSNPARKNRAITYYSATALCTATLARRYAISSPRLSAFLRRRTRWLLSAALRPPLALHAIPSAARTLLASLRLH